VVREGVGAGGEMNQALYAHMNNKTIKKRKPDILAAHKQLGR
jgi:NaMN:DMB phosphoribosyltransferase